ncbi:MAG TPA: tRNA (N(6)-L-threonylcarbamoyladenosine(37)-C(2))-methylthiotransferase MtaB [Methylomirabilota bacterium]|nr:tRNA (N(6)-L-threonylcarbamoyladenosine(37)-C(2))-methylthiotransferase MtaB [Methylomirabilota bacterium]
MSAPVTVALATLGCRLNQVESREIGALLESRGFRVVEPAAGAQVFVINTCTVTGRADFSDRQLIRRIARENPEAYLVVTGCFAQTDPAAAAAIAGVDLVVGNQEKYRLPELLGSLAKRARPDVAVADIGAARDVPIAPFARVTGRSRAFVKIQDGCQHRCAFCIVPAARGRSRSQESKVVLDQVRDLVAVGYLDVTLTGVDIGHYGRDLYPRTTLAALLRELAEIDGLRWLRLSSVLPSYFTPELVDAVTTLPVVAPHLHLPLQSGSDRVLRLMRRPYHTGMYRALVDRLTATIPGLGLGADVIAGHPGETEDDFEATLRFVEALPFSSLHVFAYSERKGTEATSRPGHVPAAVIRERSGRLRRLGHEKSLAFRRGLIGRRRDAVVLGARDRRTGLLAGLTDNYIEVLFDGPDTLGRRVVPLTITEAHADRTHGQLEEIGA